MKVIYHKLKGLYYKQKVTDDLIERMLKKMPEDTVPTEVFAKIEEVDRLLTEKELREIEERINKL